MKDCDCKVCGIHWKYYPPSPMVCPECGAFVLEQEPRPILHLASEDFTIFIDEKGVIKAELINEVT